MEWSYGEFEHVVGLQGEFHLTLQGRRKLPRGGAADRSER